MDYVNPKPPPIFPKPNYNTAKLSNKLSCWDVKWSKHRFLTAKQLQLFVNKQLLCVSNMYSLHSNMYSLQAQRSLTVTLYQ
jgi:hypothetical protein